MKYDDLLNVPYKPLGRDKNGLDCYGLVLECCKRNGTPLNDVYKDIETLPINLINDYISKGLNVRETKQAKKGNLVLCSYRGNTHIAFIIERNIVIHATKNGVKTSPILALHPIAFYEVINDSNTL